jgi:polyferredoxin
MKLFWLLLTSVFVGISVHQLSALSHKPLVYQRLGLSLEIGIVVTVLYACLVRLLLFSKKNWGKKRKAIWSLFALVFFSQLALGLLGFPQFLMIGKLHYPIPALIVGGAVYELKFGFMQMLFLGTVLLSGPLWCGWLCYFGPIDNVCSGQKALKESVSNPDNIRLRVLATVILVAVFARLVKVPISWIHLGVIVFLAYSLWVVKSSRNTGRMNHCSRFCPLGLVANTVGCLAPFKVRIKTDKCCKCGKCIKVCRYFALDKEKLEIGKLGINCTNCGDCIAVCPTQCIQYSIFGFHRPWMHEFYVSFIVFLHVIFIVTARV